MTTKNKVIELKKTGLSRLGAAIALMAKTEASAEDQKAFRASLNGLKAIQKEVKAEIDELSLADDEEDAADDEAEDENEIEASDDLGDELGDVAEDDSALVSEDEIADIASDDELSDELGEDLGDVADDVELDIADEAGLDDIAVEDDLLDSLGDSGEGDALDDLSDEDDLLSEDEEIVAYASLDIATKMLKAELEEDEEAASEDEEAVADDEEAAADDEEAAVADDVVAEDDAAVADADAEPSEEDDSAEPSEDEPADDEASDDVAVDDESSEEIVVEDDLGDAEVAEDDTFSEESTDDPEDEGGEGPEDDAEVEDDEGEILSEDELAALAAEGLIDASTRMKYRLAALAASLPDFDDAEAMPADYWEDPEELFTEDEFIDVLASFTAAERKDIYLPADAVLSAAKMTEADRRKMEKSGKKNRKLRNFRSKWKTSPTGKKSSVRLPDGKTKKVKKKFYFSTYDSKGNFLGTMWFLKNKVNKSTTDAYKEKYGVKHPSLLPAKDDATIAAKKPAKK